jgi:CubicO group peptidase (beta-lactamase class C family)
MSDEAITRAHAVETGLRATERQRTKRRPAETIAERMRRLEVPGASVAVINDGQIEWARGYGVRDAERGGAVDTGTLFQAGSISKPTAVLGALVLVERGLLDLDADINDYLTSWKVPGTAGWQPRVTPRQLMSHTAGLTVHGFPGYRRGNDVPTLPQLLNGEGPANTPPVYVDILPGTQFRYSGGGTTVLQLAMQEITGRPVAEFLREAVLEPLGMSNSTFEQPLPERLWRQAAVGHRSGSAVVSGGWHVYPEQAAAGLWTTASDLARMAIAVQRMLAGEPGGILLQATVREMLTPVVDRSSDAVGLGFFLDQTGESKRFGHSGSDEGFISLLTAYCEVGRGAAVMTNSDSGWILAQEVLQAVAEVYEWPDYPAPTPEAMPPTPEFFAGFAGRYRVRHDVELEVSTDGQQLFIAAPDQPPVALVQSGDRDFFAEILDTRVSFEAGQDGEIAALTLEQSDASSRAEKVA